MTPTGMTIKITHNPPHHHHLTAEPPLISILLRPSSDAICRQQSLEDPCEIKIRMDVWHLVSARKIDVDCIYHRSCC